MKSIIKILTLTSCITFWISLVILMLWFQYLLYNHRNISNENNSTDLNKSEVLSDKYYIREVYSDSEDPFAVHEIDTILILDQKKGFIKWGVLHSYKLDSNFSISTRYSDLINHIKPINKK